MFREAAQAAAGRARRSCRPTPRASQRLGERLRAAPPRAVVTCARGSSDHAATFARYLIETRLRRAHLLRRAVGQLGLRGDDRPLRHRDARDLAVGREPGSAGERCASARDAGARIVALVNAESSPLAQLADDLLPLRAGPERSVAATKSYIASLAAIAQLVASWAADAELSAALRETPGAARARLAARLERRRDAPA